MLTYERAHELFEADFEAGTLTWRADRASGSVKAGTRAGTRRADGYRKVNVDGAQYYEHRVLWLMAHGEWPPELDHRNRDPSRNALRNLRPATRSENMQNTTARGVTWHKARRKWQAQIKLDGRNKYLGTFVCFGQALAARRAARVEQHPFALEGV